MGTYRVHETLPARPGDGIEVDFDIMTYQARRMLDGSTQDHPSNEFTFCRRQGEPGKIENQSYPILIKPRDDAEKLVCSWTTSRSASLETYPLIKGFSTSIIPAFFPSGRLQMIDFCSIMTDNIKERIVPLIFHGWKLLYGSRICEWRQKRLIRTWNKWYDPRKSFKLVAYGPAKDHGIL